MKKIVSLVIVMLFMFQLTFINVTAETTKTPKIATKTVQDMSLEQKQEVQQQSVEAFKKFTEAKLSSIKKIEQQEEQVVGKIEQHKPNKIKSFNGIIKKIFEGFKKKKGKSKSLSNKQVMFVEPAQATVSLTPEVLAQPVEQLTANGTLIDEFDSTEGLAPYNANITLDTSNKISGGGSIKLQSTTTGYFALDKTLQLDLSNSKNFEVNTYIEDKTKIDSIAVVLFTNNNYNDYIVDYIGQYELNNGWNCLRRELSKFTNNNASLSNTTLMRLVVNFNSPEITINFDKVQHNVVGKTEVMFNFEGGYYETYTEAYPILKAKGYTANVFPIKQIVEYQNMEFLDYTDLTNLYRAGWDIGNCTESYPTNMSTLTYEQKKLEYSNAKDWLNKNNWTRGSDFVAYPLGFCDNDTLRIMSELNVKSAFTMTYGIQTVPAENLYNLKTININETTTLDFIKSDIDKALNTGSSIAFTIGKINTTQLTEVVNYISSKNIEVATMSKWYSQHQGLAYQTPEILPALTLPAPQNYSQVVKFTEKTTKLKISNGTLMNQFDSLNGWGTARRGTLSLDTTNKMDGTASLKLASQVIGGGGSSIIEYKSSTPIDLSKISSLQMGFYTDNPAAIYAISVAFYDNDIYHSNYAVNYTGGYELMKGWNKIIRDTADFNKYGTNPIGNIYTIRITVSANAGYNPVVGIDNFRYNIAGITKILFTFDDAWSDVLTNGYPILQAKGYKGTLWACQELATCDDPDFLSVTQLNTMYKNGWDIGNHSKTHDDNIAGLPYAQKYVEYSDNKAWINKNRWKRAVNHVCYPMGSHNDELITVLKSLGVKTARTTIYGIQPVGVEDIYRLKTIPVGKDIPMSLIKDEIDKAVASGSTVMFMLHRIENTPTEVYDISTASFQELVNYVNTLDKANKLDVQTISQWYTSYNQKF